MGQEQPKAFEWGRGGEHGVVAVCCNFARHAPAPHLRCRLITLVVIDPFTPKGRLPCLLICFRQGPQLSHTPLLHEADLLLPGGVNQGRWQLVANDRVAISFLRSTLLAPSDEIAGLARILLRALPIRVIKALFFLWLN